MNLEKKVLHKTVEAEMLDASTLMTVKELLHNKTVDYKSGFLEGYNLCLNLARLYNSIFTAKS